MPNTFWKKILILPAVPALGLGIFVITLVAAFLWYQSQPPIPLAGDEAPPAVEQGSEREAGPSEEADSPPAGR